MTVELIKDNIIIKNPDNLPLENLSFKNNLDGVHREIKAFSNHWLEQRFHARYPGAPKSGSIEEEQWLNSMTWYNKELEWMLHLEHFKFWSNMVFDTGCIVSLVSFLQEASPFYYPFEHENVLVNEAYSLAYHRVLQVFCRLITNKENEKSWMGKEFLANLLYDHSLITVPILWDITVIYGGSNTTVLIHFMDAIFKIQPKYKNDLEIAYTFLKEKVFTTIERQSGGFSAKSPSNSIEQHNLDPKPSNAVLADLALHLLDCAATMRHFFEIYPPAKITCRNLKMCISIARLYDNCIPTLYNKLDSNNANTVSYARVELLQCYKLMIDTCTAEALAKPDKAIVSAELFLEIISETLAELSNQKAFVTDLLTKQPLQNDLELFRQLCPDLDPVKCDFILQSLMSSYDDSNLMPDHLQNFKFGKGSENGMRIENINSTEKYDEDGACGGLLENKKIEISSGVSEISDVFPHLGAGYIKRLLDYFGSPENVITALLEDNIPDEFNNLDKTEPLIPPDPLDELYSKIGNTHLNVYDGDQFDERIQEVPKDLRRNKNKRGPKNLNELLNDKSHIKELKSKYQEYNLVYDNVYDDEYDDSYEGPTKTVTEEGPGSTLRRPMEIPRVLRTQLESESESEEDVDEVESSSKANPPTKFQPFCENPETIRERREAQRTGKMPSRDVVGKPKGHGQEKEVVVNRDKKNTQKSSRANHNRRQGAQWKRSRGMMPS